MSSNENFSSSILPIYYSQQELKPVSLYSNSNLNLILENKKEEIAQQTPPSSFSILIPSSSPISNIPKSVYILFTINKPWAITRLLTCWKYDLKPSYAYLMFEMTNGMYYIYDLEILVTTIKMIDITNKINDEYFLMVITKNQEEAKIIYEEHLEICNKIENERWFLKNIYAKKQLKYNFRSKWEYILYLIDFVLNNTNKPLLFNLSSLLIIINSPAELFLYINKVLILQKK